MLLLENVKKAYVEPNGALLPILDIPAFQLARGEQMALAGPSGCGKTTLLHIIAGISRADCGVVRVDGLDIGQLSEAGRDRYRAAKIGYVFQTFNLLAGFTALENVLLGMTFTRTRRDVQRANELLRRVGLGERAAHKPAALSVGEQQRVAVARALANRPRLLLADEPTANVDPANQKKIVELIRGTCQEEDVALLLVTHADEVAVEFERVERLNAINRVPAAAAPHVAEEAS
jgi:putative ABC transport system ATP-binding protein